MEDRDADRTETQREWAEWAAHGYRKRYQPRSMLLWGGVFFLLFGIGLVIVVWLAASGRWP
jgi:hypothetical protein